VTTATAALGSSVHFCTEQQVDQDQLAHLRTIEAAEREQLAMFGQRVANGEAAR
jgi:hypothetical protein